jgi:hypothetical protein
MNYIEKSALEVNGIAWLEKFLSFHNGFIAGGCFKNIFSNQSVKDIDIFFKNYTDYENAFDYFKQHDVSEKESKDGNKEYQFVYQNDKCICYRHIPTGIKIELIDSIFGEPKDILEQFDFTISKYAYYNKKITDPFEDEVKYELTCVYHQDFFEHLTQKKLVIDDKIPFPVSTFERVLRYTSYGYNLCKESRKKLIIALNQIEKIENEQFSDSFYGNGNGGWD